MQGFAKSSNINIPVCWYGFENQNSLQAATLSTPGLKPFSCHAYDRQPQSAKCPIHSTNGMEIKKKKKKSAGQKRTADKAQSTAPVSTKS